MEILAGVHIIESQFDGRRLASYLLNGEQALLFDSGFAYTPQETLFPYFEGIGIGEKALEWLLISHASADHFGGNDALKRRYPHMKIVAQEIDAPSIASHQRFVQDHKNWTAQYGIEPQAVSEEDFAHLFGPETTVDLSVTDGEWLALSPDWSVQILHCPGHTPGHLILYDPRNRAAFVGDALLGDGVPDVNGRLVMPPHYFEVEWYLQSMRTIGDLDIDHLFATHYPPMSGEEIGRFVDDSRHFVDKCRRALLELFDEFQRPAGAADLIEGLRAKIGIPGAENQYQLLLRAHLNELTAGGRLSLSQRGTGYRWQLTDAGEQTGHDMAGR